MGYEWGKQEIQGSESRFEGETSFIQNSSASHLASAVGRDIF
jgi:hypothetical protein